MTAPLVTPLDDEQRQELLVGDGGSRVAAKEIGLQGWCVAGWQDYGAVYGKALAFAQQEMRTALARGLDPVTHEVKPRADPVGALERLVYDLLVIATEGLPRVAEMPPIQPVEWAPKKPPTREMALVAILHDLLMETDVGRLTVDGVAYAMVPDYGVHSWSSAAMQRAVRRIVEWQAAA